MSECQPSWSAIWDTTSVPAALPSYSPPVVLIRVVARRPKLRRAREQRVNGGHLPLPMEHFNARLDQNARRDRRVRHAQHPWRSALGRAGGPAAWHIAARRKPVLVE